jgi:serpin B
MPPADTADASAFAQAMNAFGLDVWEGLRTSGHDTNLAISPASLATALAMTYGGARGETATAMARALHVGSDPDATMRAAGLLVSDWNDASRTSYELAVANRLFGARAYRFAPAYLAATRDHFGAELEPLDFLGDADGSRRRINDWVAHETQDRIRDLLPSGAILPDTTLVLVNAVYFHGQWLETFDHALTVDAPFAASGVERVDVPMMAKSGGRYGKTTACSCSSCRTRGTSSR